MELSWTEDVDVNMRRGSYAALEQDKWQVKQKRKQIIRKNRRAKGRRYSIEEAVGEKRRK